MRGRRVLVTGGTGFVGRALCQLLLERGWSVTVATRSEASAVEGCDRLVLGELEEYTSQMDLRGFEAVVHLAARVHKMNRADSDALYESANLHGTRHLAESAEASGVQHFVFVSSIKVLGETFPPERPANEDLPLAPKDAYAESKAAAEGYLLAREYSMAVTVLRPPIVYGPGVGANFGALLRASKTGWPLPLRAIGSPRSMIAVENLCSAILQVLEKAGSSNQVWVVRDGRDLPVRAVVRHLRRSLGKRDPQVPLPLSLLQLGGQVMRRERQVARLTAPLSVDDSRIRRDLSWRPPLTVEQGLEEVLGLPPRARRLLFIVSEDWYFWSHRLGLARRAIAAGWEVHLACRISEHERRIQDHGIAVHPIRVSRAGRNPLEDLQFIAQLRQVVREVAPDVVHNVAMKPIIYGSLVSGWCGVPAVVSTIAGMGSLFPEAGVSKSAAPNVTRRLVEVGLRLSQRRVTNWLVVQNVDDYRLVDDRIIDSRRLVLIPGSGLDLAEYPFAPRKRSGEVVITHVSRMLWDKGVSEVVQGTILLRSRGVPVRLQVVGAPDPDNPRSIPASVLEGWSQNEGIEWLGRREDVAAIWRETDIAVLASYYGEGIPRALLEAAATGLPLVGCDSPGIRDLIQHDVNGLLVPPRDQVALADAIQLLVEDASRASRLGLRARSIVEERYADEAVLGDVLKLYDTALGVGV